MKEYIEREKLTKHIEDEIEAFGNPNESDNPVAYGGLLSMKYCRSAVVTAPTADVVEVVRCKDCKYYIPKENLADEYANPIGADGLCDNTDKYTDEDDYCSYGERKEQG